MDAGGRAVFGQADSVHKGFYEGLATRVDVEDALEVEKLVAAVQSLIEGAGVGGSSCPLLEGHAFWASCMPATPIF